MAHRNFKMVVYFFSERFLDKFSSFFICDFILSLTYLGLFLMILVVFSDSLAFSASIPLFFVQKYSLGDDFGPNQHKKSLKACLRSAQRCFLLLSNI